MFGLFFEQNHLLNLIILGVHTKRWPKYAHIYRETEQPQEKEIIGQIKAPIFLEAVSAIEIM